MNRLAYAVQISNLSVGLQWGNPFLDPADVPPNHEAIAFVDAVTGEDLGSISFR